MNHKVHQEHDGQDGKRHFEPVAAEVEELARGVIGAAIEVHRHLGPGFLEDVYEQAMMVELSLLGLPVVRQEPVPLSYKGQPVGFDRIDLWIDKRLVVELKAVERLAPIHDAQLMSYLRATQCRLGLLINFNVPRLTDGLRRIIL